jgi:hypothetical protein
LGPFRARVADFNGDGLPDYFGGNGGEEACADDFGGTNTLLLTNEAGKLIDASDQLLGPPCTLSEPLYPDQAPCYHGGEAPERPTGVRYPDSEADPVALFRDNTHSTASGDIDNDGDIDIFVGNYGGDGGYEAPYFLINDGEGNFIVDYDSVPVDWRTASDDNFMGFPVSHIDDLDGDGAQDFLACCRDNMRDEGAPVGTFTVSGGIYWGDGSGDFSTAERMPFPRAREKWAGTNGDLLPMDIDDDGDKDLIVLIEHEAIGIPAQHPDALPVFIQVLVNHGNRQFVDETTDRISKPTSILNWVIFLTELDFNADGCPDFLIEVPAPYWNENLYVNDCRGNFTPLPPAVVGKFRHLVPIDVHGDGGVDFISYTSSWWDPGEGDFAILEQLRPIDIRPWLPIIFIDSFEQGDTSQ